MHAVKYKAAEELLCIFPIQYYVIELESSSSSYPHHLKENSKILRAEAAKEKQERHGGQLLDLSDTDIEDMLSIIDTDVDVEGGVGANACIDAITDSFLTQAGQIEDTLPPAVRGSVLFGVLDPITVGVTPAAEELGALYANANIFGRCDIHLSVMQHEIIRLEALIEAMIGRKTLLEKEIATQEKQCAEATKRFQVARAPYSEVSELDHHSICREQDLRKSEAEIKESTCRKVSSGSTPSRWAEPGHTDQTHTSIKASRWVSNQSADTTSACAISSTSASAIDLSSDTSTIQAPEPVRPSALASLSGLAINPSLVPGLIQSPALHSSSGFAADLSLVSGSV
ncbi:hypothetical protein MMC07_009258 [Pseudocyphellaria aurata]|nr:hypothetical protein [Pseudocyphellaria aurata]